MTDKPKTAARVLADQLAFVESLHADWRHGKISAERFDKALADLFGAPALAQPPAALDDARELLAYLGTHESAHPQYGTWTSETERRVLKFLKRLCG